MCKTKVVFDPRAFTVESSASAEILAMSDTVFRASSKKPSSSTASSVASDSTLLREMSKAMKKPASKKSGLETSILSAVAEGDEALADAYMALSIDPASGARKLTKEIVAAVASKAKINVSNIAKMISKAQKVSICFLLDTTGSMASYISGVKSQIIEIVRRVEASGCQIAGLAFVGYKDWCDGKLFTTVHY